MRGITTAVADPLCWDDADLLTNTHILLRLRILPAPVSVTLLLLLLLCYSQAYEP